MNCPNQIADIVLQIVRDGIISARLAGWGDRARLSALEANHVHNLPDLLREYAPEKLEYYWNIERPEYMRDFSAEVGEEPKRFQEYWKQLEPLVPKG